MLKRTRMDAHKHLTDISGPPEHEASTQIMKSTAKLLFELVENAVLGGPQNHLKYIST